MDSIREDEKTVEDVKKIGNQLSILPIKGTVVFPYLIVPLVVTEQKYTKLIDETLMEGKIIGLFAQKSSAVEHPSTEDIYKVGTAASILKMLRFPDGSVRFLVQGLSRVRVKNFVKTEPYPIAKIEVIEEKVKKNVELEALIRNVLDLLKKVVDLAPYLSEELQVSAINTEDPSRLADLIASNLNIKVAQKQQLLEAFDTKERLRKVLSYINREVEVLELSQRIQSQAASELGKTQKEYILREQLKAIQRELGEADERTAELDEFKRKIKEAEMLPEALDAAKKELDRLSKMNPAAAEYTVSRTYLDWLVNLPWSKSTQDVLDIKKVKKILDEDHYDLEKVKERILEYLAVRKLKQDMKGPILCFVGPPGVGKTSLGISIARAMGRKFNRISLGGMRDEAEIRGHRRTYIGALPGRIIQGIRRAGSNNPVFMLDEVDKIGQDFRGDPASALLEVLDPEQNNTFSDHYLDVSFDLSKVMFITTANILDPIPRVLRDRMETIELPGYTDLEKLQIAKRHLVPKELKNHGLGPENLMFQDKAIRKMATDYTREAGLRNLDREIATVCRKVAKMVASGKKRKVEVTPKNLEKFLGPVKFFQEMVQRTPQIGVVPGVAWTQTGGDLMFVEATKMKGKKSLTLTGHLGEVMKESAQTALSYIRSTSKRLGIEEDFFEKYDIHVHVPAGAIPKDGPSAGITMATAIASLLIEKPVKTKLAMTGELTLRGEILPIGGLKEKTLAAYRAGVETLILPKENQKDMVEIPDEIKRKIKFTFVETMDEVLKLALDKKRKVESQKKKGSERKKRSSTR
ncbi:MAG: endopeptidase La [candidate division Zixibacteria bacterium]|nr:endopeptidase La [candidate division Zixibacteria bacterium]